MINSAVFHTADIVWEPFELQRQKITFGHVRPAKIQISLRIRAVWSESSLGTFWIAILDSFFMWTTMTDQTALADMSLRLVHIS